MAKSKKTQKPLVTFKRVNKKEWKKEPAYTVYDKTGLEIGYIYFFDQDEDPIFEYCEINLGSESTLYQKDLTDKIKMLKIIEKKLIAFKKEVYEEMEIW